MELAKEREQRISPLHEKSEETAKPVTPIQEIENKIGDINKMREDSRLLSDKMRLHEKRQKLFQKVSKDIPKPVDATTPEGSASWQAMDDPARREDVKHFLGHSLAADLKGQPVDRVVSAVLAIPAYKDWLEADKTILTRGERAAGSGVVEKVYKLMHEEIGEIIALLSSPAYQQAVKEASGLIAELRMVRLAVMARMMTKVG